jgi:hypothetical protein
MEELKQRIKEEITAILQQMICRVMENHRGRLDQCLRNGGDVWVMYCTKYKTACSEFFNDSICYIIW